MWWLWPLALAIINPLLCLASNVFQLTHRRRQLAARYRERYGALRLRGPLNVKVAEVDRPTALP